MSFRFEELQRHFASSLEKGRLGHAYLITGDRSEHLENLATGLCGQVLGGNPITHPDFHPVRPQSKSRRIKVGQIRELEKSLHLHAAKGKLKVAVIFDAERMCIDAAAANAFLKTLEEPPRNTLIMLTCSRPALLLSTIVSRCMHLDMGFADVAPEEGPDSAWIREGWLVNQTKKRLRAYARAQILLGHWADLREVAEKHLKEHDEFDDELAEAWLAAEHQLSRQESIAQLQRWYWHRSEQEAQTTLQERVRAIIALEDLHAALASNVDSSLEAIAVERNCLLLEGAL